MKAILLIAMGLFLLATPSHANTITIGPGGAITIGDDVVVCTGGTTIPTCTWDIFSSEDSTNGQCQIDDSSSSCPGGDHKLIFTKTTQRNSCTGEFKSDTQSHWQCC